jgi:hypothetical protein
MGEGWQAAGEGLEDRIGHPDCGGSCGATLCRPAPIPPHAWNVTDQALGANSYLKVMVPKSTNVTFQEQKKMGIAVVSKLI